jgi:hypothetical protein
MHTLQIAVFETLLRIQRFIDEDTATLEAVNQSAARKRLDETVARISAYVVAQADARRAAEAETANLRILRVALRFEHMLPVAVVAGQRLREQPEFKLLRMPRREPGLTWAAYDMANAAEKYADLFVHEGLPLDFVAKLRAAAQQLDQSIEARNHRLLERADATEGLKTEIKRARDLIQLLDALVRPKLRSNQDLLRTWQIVSHVRWRAALSGAASPCA